MKFVPLARNVAVMAGVAVKEPFVSVMKFVMVTMPPAGRVKDEAKAGVWAKEVTLVAGPLPPAVAGAGLWKFPPPPRYDCRWTRHLDIAIGPVGNAGTTAGHNHCRCWRKSSKTNWFVRWPAWRRASGCQRIRCHTPCRYWSKQRSRRDFADEPLAVAIAPKGRIGVDIGECGHAKTGTDGCGGGEGRQ